MIYIIITTSINSNYNTQHENHRKKRYIESIQYLLNLVKEDATIKPIVVENNGQRHTYLDDLNCEICYTHNNDVRYKHKGENELLDIKEVIQRYHIKDDDMVIKITGRYKLLNLNFIHLLKEHSNYDAFIKFFNVCTRQYDSNDSVLGLFSIKCKFLKEFNYHFANSPEVEFAIYVRNTIETNKIYEVSELGLECCFADDLRLLNV